MQGVENNNVVVTAPVVAWAAPYALALARAGANAVVNDLGVDHGGISPRFEAPEAFVDDIEASGGVAVADPGTVTDGGDVEALINPAIETFGALDGVVSWSTVTRPARPWALPLTVTSMQTRSLRQSRRWRHFSPEHTALAVRKTVAHGHSETPRRGTGVGRGPMIIRNTTIHLLRLPSGGSMRGRACRAGVAAEPPAPNRIRSLL